MLRYSKTTVIQRLLKCIMTSISRKNFHILLSIYFYSGWIDCRFCLIFVFNLVIFSYCLFCYYYFVSVCLSLFSCCWSLDYLCIWYSFNYFIVISYTCNEKRKQNQIMLYNARAHKKLLINLSTVNCLFLEGQILSLTVNIYF